MNRVKNGLFILMLTAFCGCLCGCGGKEIRRKTLLPAPAIDFIYEPVDGEIMITGYRGTEKEILVPDMVNLVLPVTMIGENAFYDNDSLTYVALPETIKSIGTQAFAACDALEEISVPDSVTSIGENAFSECDAVLRVKAGSYALEYAETNGIAYKIK